MTSVSIVSIVITKQVAASVRHHDVNWDKLTRYAYRAGRRKGLGHEDARDMAQTVAEDVLIHGIDDRFGIVVNATTWRISEHYRRSKYRKTEPIPVNMASHTNPWPRLYANELLSRLPLQQAQDMIRHYCLGETTQEIGESTGRSQQVVSKWIKVNREVLREQLG